MKVTTNSPEPVEPTVVVEMTQHEALVVKRVMSHVLVCGPEGEVTYALFSALGVVPEDSTVSVPRAANVARYPRGYLTFEKE